MPRPLAVRPHLGFSATLAALFAIGSVASLVADDSPEKEIRPFNGRDLTGWTTKEPKDRNRWTVGQAKMNSDAPRELIVTAAEDVPELVNATSGGVDIYTEEKFGDCTIEVEFMVPRGSNSGIYVMGEYEVQILDSYGKEQVGPGDVGGLYGAAAPKTNAAKAPGQWQKFVIEFQAPRFEGDEKVANAVFKKITLNDVVIHENVEMSGPTPSGVTGKEAPTGPLMFQGDHGPVSLRNLVIRTAE
jgi:hypothetical protein